MFDYVFELRNGPDPDISPRFSIGSVCWDFRTDLRTVDAVGSRSDFIAVRVDGYTESLHDNQVEW